MPFVEIAVVVALILLNGLFAMAEMALVSSRRPRLQAMAEGGDKGAAAALHLLEDQSRLLSTVQIGITLIGILSGAFSGATLADPLGDRLDEITGIRPYGDAIAFAIVVVCVTYLSLVAGELVPKRLALRNPEPLAALAARPMRALARGAGPLVWLLRTSTEGLLRLLGRTGNRDDTVTEEEIRTVLDEGSESGAIDPQERQLIEGVMRLADRSVRSIMTPRPDVTWLDPADPPADILAEIRQSGLSRFPVCKGAVDEIIGIVQAKDLLAQFAEHGGIDLTAALREPLLVHESTPILKLLDIFRASPIHMAAVIDEYGSLQGVATLTDIIGGIAGSLPEEGDDDDPELVRRSDGSFLVDGLMAVDAFEDASGIRGLVDPEGEYSTVAGFVLWRLGHLPEAGESFTAEGCRFEVVDMDGRRIDKVLVQPLPPSEP